MVARQGLLIAVVAIIAHAGAAPATTTPSDEQLTRAIGQPFYSGQVVPAPREAVYRDETVVLYDGPKGYRLCEPMVEYFGPARDLLLRLFERRMEAYTNQFDKDWRTPDSTQSLPILFALAGDANAKYLLDRYELHDAADSLRPQGYLLEIGPLGILCAGKDNQGLVNGLASLLQLIHVKDGRLVVRCAGLVDWPTFTTRYTAEYSLGGADFFEWMVWYKLNGFASCYPAMRWQGLSDGHKKAMRVIKETKTRYGTMDYMVQFHVGGRRNEPVDCGDAEDIGLLLKTIAETLELSDADHIMLCYDDVWPRLQPKEKGTFERPAQAHGSLVDKVYRHVQALRPGTIVSFCTAYYQGGQHRKWRPDSTIREEGLQYLKDTRQWNPNVRLVWTGPVTESRVIKPEDINWYRKQIGTERPLFYWDNTWHYHQPLRNFHSQYPDGFVYECADKTGYVNINGTKAIGEFFSATAADYYWNSEGFDPKRSRKNVVAQFMGPQAVTVAERFYDFRGDGYMYYFSRMAKLDTFRAILEDLEEVCWDEDLMAVCWSGYNSVAKVQKKPPHKAAR